MFDARELQLVIGGEQRALDVANLRRWTGYGGGYHAQSESIGWFWSVLEELTPQEQGDFLKFVTSCSRQPLLGFEFLDPKFGVQRVPSEGGVRLPMAATCMNLLKLPEYPSRAMLKAKLLFAISAQAGFELS